MSFMILKEMIQDNFKTMVNNGEMLFEVNLDSDELWNLYLDSFPSGTNEIFRQRREYDCSCCRHFIKNIGNVVSIKDGIVKSLWDFEIDNKTFKPVVEALSNFVKSKSINGVYLNYEKSVGTDKNFEKNGVEVLEWDHFYLNLPNHLITSKSSLGSKKGELVTTKNVFKRSLEEISQESVLTVLELISSNTLYKGSEWKSSLTEFLRYKKEYDGLDDIKKDLYSWEKSLKAGIIVGRIKNHSIGTLLINISEGMDLDTAVRKYEAIVAPTNYKRPKAIFTKKMIEEAQESITRLGYNDSLGRRFANLDDITINNILFSNRDSANRISNSNVFDDLLNEACNKPKKFNKIEEITIEKFINSILPTAKEVEVYLENKHSKNMVSLIAPKIENSKTMFKWDNNFTWAYSGNITDSSMKENVKSAGGNVEGVLRFSIQWNDEESDRNDLDAHCVEPNGNHIYFGDRNNYNTTGQLDVDIITPKNNVVAVENITWTDINKMQQGTYKFYVNNYSHRGGRSGFKAEIEFEGQTYYFDYNKELRDGENVMVAEVTYNKISGFTIKELLLSSISSKEVWGLRTNEFVPVSVAMMSPNYWNEQQGIGNKHYFFMLKDCVNSESPNGFYNEFLKEDLLKHKRVFEALGGKMRVDDVEDQLSGIGFSSTKRDELIIKVKAQTERVLKIKF